jgi:sugar lactone lactonase YvrE
MYVSVSTMSTLAGQLSGNYAEGIGTNAIFNSPYGICQNTPNRLYVADSSTHTVRVLTTAGSVGLLAGVGGTSGYTDGFGSNAKFSNPLGVDCDSTGVYVADSQNNQIRKVTLSGEVTTIAGSRSQGSNDGTGVAAFFNSPNSVALSSDGTALYVADTNSNAIRQVVLSSGVTTTLVSGAGAGTLTDGCGASAKLWHPVGLKVYGGSIYFTDIYNRAVRQYSLSAGE